MKLLTRIRNYHRDYPHASYREIATALDCSHWYVKDLLRPARAVERVSSVHVRCKVCGGMCLMPCRVCKLEGVQA